MTRLASRFVWLLAVVAAAGSGTDLMAQTPALGAERPPYVLPDYLSRLLTAEDRALFTRLLNVNIESAWSYLRDHGYPYSFTNAVEPVHPDMRFTGRARTGRYLPFRTDLEERQEGLQLNYRSAEDTQPGDVIVFDMGGDLLASPSGDVTSTRAMVRGCAGIVVYGIMRDVPGFIDMGLPLFTLDGKGHASAVKPRTTSWDYQVPIRLGDVTVMPGDYLVGARHGVLVIPAHLVEEVLEYTEFHDEREAFQRMLLLQGESMVGVYPPNEDTLRRFEEWRKNRR